MKRIIPLFLTFSMLIFCGCAGNYAVNPLFGICLMANDSLYVCERITDKPPQHLEYIGEIENYGSALPQNNFESTSNDYGTQLWADPGDSSVLYTYDDTHDEYWVYIRSRHGVALNGILYISNTGSGAGDTYEFALPEGYTSTGTVTALSSGMPANELEAFGLTVGSEIFSNSENEQYIYAYTGNTGTNKYLRLNRFINIETE